jgi:hypothetical protein
MRSVPPDDIIAQPPAGSPGVNEIVGFVSATNTKIDRYEWITRSTHRISAGQRIRQRFAAGRRRRGGPAPDDAGEAERRSIASWASPLSRADV